MHLTAVNLVHYLIARGTIGPEAVVEGTLRIVNFGRRNRNFKVFLGDTSGVFVKQASTPGPETYGGLSREATFLGLARARPEYTPLLERMPRLIDHDPGRFALTVELLHPAEDLRERLGRLGHLSEGLAEALGRALGRLHTLGPTLLRHPDDVAGLPRIRPWLIDSIVNAASLHRQMSPSQVELLAAIHRSAELSYGIDGLRKAWQAVAPIHGDLKRDNIMARPDAHADGPGPWFIDWEIADIGDPAWDLAGLFATCLELTLHRVETDDLADAYPGFKTTWPAVAALWRGYAGHLGLSPARQDAFRIKSIHYLGAKLLLFAFELLGTRPEATPTTRLLPKLARSIMVDPARAGEELLGFGRHESPIRP